MAMPEAVEMIVERDIIVLARDGVGLVTDVYRPTGEGRFRCCWSVPPTTNPHRAGPSAQLRSRGPAHAPRSRNTFVRNGYAVVYQDCRGRYKSGGRFTKYLSEAEDGYDTLDWLVRQSWCNGRIGTFGLSYAAHAQAALGCLDPPGLAAQFLDCGGFSNAYRSGIRHGGAFDLKQATWAYNNALADAKDPAVKAAAQGSGHQSVVRANAVAQGRLAAQRGAGIRGLPVRAMVARHLRRFLEAAGDLCGRLLRPLRRRTGPQPLRLV